MTDVRVRIAGLGLMPAVLLVSLLAACNGKPPEPAAKAGLIELASPLPDAVVTSPLAVEGRARGPWFFEASFPVYLVTDEGDTLVATPAQAQGEWMTADFVPFKATLQFAPPAAERGILVLQKSNASGLPEHDDELRVPVRFH